LFLKKPEQKKTGRCFAVGIGHGSGAFFQPFLLIQKSIEDVTRKIKKQQQW
jgi:hypothetical protein